MKKHYRTILVTALVLASALVVTLAIQKRDLMERLQETGTRAVTRIGGFTSLR